ncbi:MAG: DUF3825 domain-containing protein [Deltaproteobacteria bacterium]|jgi:hypothetical protein|nr:DUF3825 domain-containing protein [Deltaproteobacteria bacterium]
MTAPSETPGVTPCPGGYESPSPPTADERIQARTGSQTADYAIPKILGQSPFAEDLETAPSLADGLIDPTINPKTLTNGQAKATEPSPAAASPSLSSLDIDNPPEIVLKDNKMTVYELDEAFTRLAAALGDEPVTLTTFDRFLKKSLKDLREQGYAKFLGSRNLKYYLLTHKQYFKCSSKVSGGVERDIVERTETPLPPLEAPAVEPALDQASPKKRATKGKAEAAAQNATSQGAAAQDATPEDLVKPTKPPKVIKVTKVSKTATLPSKSEDLDPDAAPALAQDPSQAFSPSESLTKKKGLAADPKVAKKSSKVEKKGFSLEEPNLFSDLTPSVPLAEGLVAGLSPSQEDSQGPQSLEAVLKPPVLKAPDLSEPFLKEPSESLDEPWTALTEPLAEPDKSLDEEPIKADQGLDSLTPKPRQDISPISQRPSSQPDLRASLNLTPVAGLDADTAATGPAAGLASKTGLIEDVAAPPVTILSPDKLDLTTPSRPGWTYVTDPTDAASPLTGRRPDFKTPGLDLRQTILGRSVRPPDPGSSSMIPGSGRVTEINLERHLVTIREENTGQIITGYVPQPNVSWFVIKTLIEKGKKDTIVHFSMKNNPDPSALAPTFNDFRYAEIDEKTSRGLSVWFHDIVFMPKPNSSLAIHPTYEQMLEKLASYAQPEKWHYNDSRRPFNFLDNYFMKTFLNLQKEKINRYVEIFQAQNRLPELIEVNDVGLAFSADYQMGAFNIGLLDHASRDVLVVVKKTDPTQKRYVFKGFTSSSDNQLGKEVATKIHPRPARTSYYQKPDELIYKNIPIDLEQDAQCYHIIVDGLKRGRFPTKFIQMVCPNQFRYLEDDLRYKQEDVEAINSELAKFIEDEPNQSTYTTIKEKLKTALELTIRQIVANPRIPLPYWNPARDKLAFILPLALITPPDYDVALVVEQLTDGDGGVVKPFVHTILTLSMASKGARLISTLQDTWLGNLKDKKDKTFAASPAGVPKPDFPPIQPRPLGPPPKNLKTLSPAVPNLSNRTYSRPPALVSPPLAAVAPPPAPVPKKRVSSQEVRLSFPEEIRSYAQPEVKDLTGSFLQKIFDFCALRTDNPSSEKQVTLQFFHEVLVQVVPRLAPENGGYSGFNPNYSDLTAVFEHFQDRFVVRRNRVDRSKYVCLVNDQREASSGPYSTAQPNSAYAYQSSAQPSVKQGVVMGPIQEKNVVNLIGEDGLQRKARIIDPYDLFLIQKLVDKEYPGVDVTYVSSQSSNMSRTRAFDGPGGRNFSPSGEPYDIHSQEIVPDLRAILNTSFPQEFFSDMVARLKEESGGNPLYGFIFDNLRIYLSQCLEVRKYLALVKLANGLIESAGGLKVDFLNNFSDIFHLQGFSEVLSQNTFGFNSHLFTAGRQSIFATFQRSTTTESFFRFHSLTNYSPNGPEVYATSQGLQKWIDSLFPPPSAALDVNISDETAWSRVIWFGSEHKIISSKLAYDLDECRYNLARSFNQVATKFAKNPKEALVAWDSVSKCPIILLPANASKSEIPEMAIGFRLSPSGKSNDNWFIDPSSVRLFSLKEAYLRAQAMRPLDNCWLTKAIIFTDH